MDTSSEEETVDDQQLHPDYEDGAQATGSVVTETVAPVSRPNLKFPKPNDYVKCTLASGENMSMKVLSQQPKRTGTNKHYVNVQVDGAEEPSSVKWTDVTAWENVEEPEHVFLFSATENASGGVRCTRKGDE